MKTPTLLFIFLLTVLALAISAESSLHKAYSDIISSGYDFHKSQLSSPNRFFEQQTARKLLNFPNNLSLPEVCKEVQNMIDIHLTIAANAQTHVVMHDLYKTLSLYPCRGLTLPQSALDLTDTMVLSDLLVEVHAGVLFYTKLAEFHPSFALHRHDWADIADLLTALYLSDGLSRSSVSTLAPSARNTILIIQTLSIILPQLATQQPQQATAYEHFQSTHTAIQAFATSHLCTSSFTLQDYADFIQFSTTLYKTMLQRNSASSDIISAPIQCIASQVQHTLQSTEFSSVAQTIRVLDQILQLDSSVFKISDALTNTNTIYFISAPTAIIPNLSSKTATIQFSLTQITSLNPLTFTPVTQIQSASKVTVTITPPGLTTPLGSVSVNASDLLKEVVVPINLNIPKNLYALTYVTIKSSSNLISTTRVAFSHAPTPATPTKDEAVTLIINNNEKISSQLPKTTSTTPIDLSTTRQLEFKASTHKNIVSSIRFTSCKGNVKNVKECTDLLSKFTPLEKSLASVVAHFPPSKSSSAGSAYLYFTSPEMKALLQPNQSYAVFLETVDVTTRISQSQFLTVFSTTVSDEELYRASFGGQSDNNNKPYPWNLITEHIHTFQTPRPLANPFITTVVVALILGLTAIFIIYVFTIFRPAPNFTTALGSINALVFTASIGVMLAGIAAYWLYFTLFQVMLPAAFLIIPCSLAIYFPLRESVSSSRLYQLLYVNQQSQAHIKEKKD